MHDDSSARPAGTGAASPQIGMDEFLARLDEGRDFVLLDTRNAEEFAHWKVEGRGNFRTVHQPYFAFLEEPEAAATVVPRDAGEVLVLCAKGDSSEFVAGLLREAGYPARNVAGGMLAYGQHLRPVRVPLLADEAERFEIWQLDRRGKGCLSYVVRAGDEAVVIDPSRHIEAYQAFVASLGARIVRVLDTHVHADHLSGGAELAKSAGASYFVTAGEGVELKLPLAPLSDGQEVRLGGEGGVSIEARVIATPGHTPGSTSYLVGGRYLFSGDTLFVRGVGRPDLGGQVEAWGRALFHTLRERIAALPDETVILPGHYAGAAELGEGGVVRARLDELRALAPELAIQSEEEFVAAMRAGVKTPPATYAEIVRVNLGLATVSPEKAAEWELGKNECAATARARAQAQRTNNPSVS